MITIEEVKSKLKSLLLSCDINMENRDYYILGWSRDNFNKARDIDNIRRFFDFILDRSWLIQDTCPEYTKSKRENLV